MPSDTGFWSKDEVENQHVFSFYLARWIGDYLPKDIPLIDMGCGFGDYLDYWSRIGFSDIVGVEGDDLEELFKHENIKIQDLAKPFDLKMIGNVVSLEVAEHIPTEYMHTYLDNLCKHCSGTLIMSWGIPGQAGFGHVNCRWNIEVIEEMKNRGFEFLYNDTMEARGVIEHYCSWFRNTILIFKKK